MVTDIVTNMLLLQLHASKIFDIKIEENALSHIWRMKPKLSFFMLICSLKARLLQQSIRTKRQNSHVASDRYPEHK